MLQGWAVLSLTPFGYPDALPVDWASFARPAKGKEKSKKKKKRKRRKKKKETNKYISTATPG